MKEKKKKALIMLRVTMLFGILVCMFASWIFFEPTGEIEDVPCYDRDNNEIQGLTCDNVIVFKDTIPYVGDLAIIFPLLALMLMLFLGVSFT